MPLGQYLIGAMIELILGIYVFLDQLSFYSELISFMKTIT